MTRATTRLVALLGHPVGHSRSPAMMTRAFADAGLDAVYTAFDVAPERLRDAVAGLFALGAAGANVTVPHKVAAAALCTSLDDAARAVGAVNVLVRAEGGFAGCNTDAPAAVAALTEAGVTLAGARVVVLGAGGAARAACVGFAHAGARAIAILARREDRARDVADAVARLGVAHRAIAPVDAPAARDAFADADVIVNASSAGMLGTSAPHEASADLGRALVFARTTAAVMDLVYAPRETPFLAAARARGMPAVDGLGMLAHQGALSVRAWFGLEITGARFRRFLDGVDETG